MNLICTFWRNSFRILPESSKVFWKHPWRLPSALTKIFLSKCNTSILSGRLEPYQVGNGEDRIYKLTREITV